MAMVTASCAQQSSGDDVRAAIEAQAAKWQASFNSGDGAGIAALYTDDGQSMPPGAATVSGRENIAAYWQDALSAGGVGVTLEVVELVAQGMHATEVGISYMLAGDDCGSNIDPYAEGPTEDNERVVSGPHLMVIVPDIELLEGIPTDPDNGGPFVMWKGTPYAHIMVPLGD
jgi:ketosteroid isomerase-like protein